MFKQNEHDNGLVLFQIAENGRYYPGKLVERTSFEHFPGCVWLRCAYDSIACANDEVMVRAADLLPLTEQEYFLIKLKGGLSREEGRRFWRTR